MKKFKKLAPLFFVFVLCMLTMSGCNVNWFGKTIDVPWYYVISPIIAVSVLAHIHIMSRTYICPHCNSLIKPKWYHFFTYLHINNKRLVKCPYCGRKSFCKIKRK